MSVFNEYAHYYDLFYQDKDYAAESDYVHRLIQAHAPGAGSILNLGCGSGRHDGFMAELGYTVTGVDLSDEMLTRAIKGAEGNKALDYAQGDVRSMRLGRHFDVVISLFHVMSYQITNKDLQDAFRTAQEHLKPGGLFVFDCWYGPGVLTDLPTVRIRDFEDDQVAITRTARPEMYPDENVVEVNYQLSIRKKSDGSIGEVNEVHRMRYLFQPEVILMLSMAGFTLVDSQEWLSAKPLELGTWNAVFICRKSGSGEEV